MRTLFFSLFLTVLSPAIWASDKAPKCYLFFQEFGVCAHISWPDPPLTFVENHFDLEFYNTETREPSRFLPKVFLTVLNFYEDRWALEPLVAIPKESHVRHVTRVFFDKPGLWYIYVHLHQENTIESELMKVYLEDY